MKLDFGIESSRLKDELITVLDKVMHLLTEYDECRKNDKLLLEKYYLNYEGIETKILWARSPHVSGVDECLPCA